MPNDTEFDFDACPRWRAAPGGISQMAARLAEIAIEGIRRRTSNKSLCEALDRVRTELAPFAGGPLDETAPAA